MSVFMWILKVKKGVQTMGTGLLAFFLAFHCCRAHCCRRHCDVFALVVR